MIVNNGPDFDALIPLRGQMFKSILMNRVQIMSTRRGLSEGSKDVACEQWKQEENKLDTCVTQVNINFKDVSDEYKNQLNVTGNEGFQTSVR